MEGIGHITRLLTEEEIRTLTARALDALPLDGRRVLVLVPDRTRTAPVPLFFRLLHDLLAPRGVRLEFLVALGTHPPLDDRAMENLMGILPGEREYRFAEVGLHNHRWHEPDTFVQVGTIEKSEIEEIAGPHLAGLPHDAGLLRSLPVTINRLVLEADHVIVCGPTFPHEVVGFSGGTKYFFPGVSGPEVINYTHWLGAVVSSFKIIGTRDTPVRRVIDRAASLIDRPQTCISLVVQGNGLAGLYVGSPAEAFAGAAQLSSQLHIRRLPKPVRRVLSVMPEMYDDVWTAAKGMYKLEPVIEDGGEVVIYAPHIDEISYTHGRLLDEVGYHVSEYFLKQWDRFRHYPGSILAHSTHLRGMGGYDAATGVERPRIRVTLATRIGPERCGRLGLGYLDPATVDVEGWEGLGEGYLKVLKAGEMLYRLEELGVRS